MLQVTIRLLSRSASFQLAFFVFGNLKFSNSFVFTIYKNTAFCRVLPLRKFFKINTSENCPQVLILMNLRKELNSVESTLTQKGGGGCRPNGG